MRFGLENSQERTLEEVGGGLTGGGASASRPNAEYLPRTALGRIQLDG